LCATPRSCLGAFGQGRRGMQLLRAHSTRWSSRLQRRPLDSDIILRRLTRIPKRLFHDVRVTALDSQILRGDDSDRELLRVFKLIFRTLWSIVCCPLALILALQCHRGCQLYYFYC